MVNKVFLLGNLGRDPEMRSTTSGTPVATFNLATNRRWNNRDGERQEETEWHKLVCFGRLAEIAGQYLSKGRQVFVEGRLQTQSWEDRQTGQTRYKTEIVVEKLQMIGPSGAGGAGVGEGSPTGAVEDLGPEPEDDDIPF